MHYDKIPRDISIPFPPITIPRSTKTRFVAHFFVLWFLLAQLNVHFVHCCKVPVRYVGKNPGWGYDKKVSFFSFCLQSASQPASQAHKME